MLSGLERAGAGFRPSAPPSSEDADRLFPFQQGKPTGAWSDQVQWVTVASSTSVYRTGQGSIFRITETVEGGLKVEVLKDGAWVPGRIGMVGLRLQPTTTLLKPAAVRALPV